MCSRQVESTSSNIAAERSLGEGSETAGRQHRDHCENGFLPSCACDVSKCKHGQKKAPFLNFLSSYSTMLGTEHSSECSNFGTILFYSSLFLPIPPPPPPVCLHLSLSPILISATSMFFLVKIWSKSLPI